MVIYDDDDALLSALCNNLHNIYTPRSELSIHFSATNNKCLLSFFCLLVTWLVLYIGAQSSDHIQSPALLLLNILRVQIFIQSLLWNQRVQIFSRGWEFSK